MTDTREQLLNDLSQRAQAAETQLAETQTELAALRDTLSPDNLRTFVSDYLGGLTDSDPLVRKMRFGGESASLLIGSKFARWGLGAADVEFLYDLMQSRARVGIGSGPSEQLTKAFEAISEAYYLSDADVREIDRQAIDDLYPRINRRNIEQHERAMRAMDTAESGYGSQLVGAQYVGDLWEAARAETRVFGLIDTFEMTAPTAYIPVEVDFPELLLVTESTANNSSNYSTVKTGSNRVSLTASKFVIHQMWSGEMEEDSIIPFVPFLRRQLALSLAYYSDSLVLNGDTTNAGTGNINLDDADPADTKHYLAFDGIRHAGLVDNTANSANLAGAITLDALAAARGRMMDNTNKHDWGHPNDPNDLIYVCDPGTADAIAALDPVLNARIYNGGTNLLSGQVAAILGYPVISSPAVSKTEADGKVSTTGNNNTKGQVVTFNRRGFKAGWRRRVKLETERIPATDQSRIVASLRMGFTRFTPTGAASGLECADVIYNVTI
jgi:HK97 family phage major capsid protein